MVSGASETSRRKLWMMLALLSVTAFLWPFLTAGANIALPAIAEYYHVDAVKISWVTNATLLVTTIFLIPVGKLGNVFGQKRAMTVAIAVTVVSSIAVYAAKSFLILLVLRGVQGFCAALLSTSGLTFISSSFPKAEQGRAMGLYTATIYMGLSAGPFLGGLIVENLRWQGIFAFTAIVGAIILPLAVKLLPKDPPVGRVENFDWTGTIIYTLSLVLIMSGMENLNSLFGASITASGAALAIAFIIYELKVPNPVFEIYLMKDNRVLAFSNLAALVSYSAVFAVAYLLSLYLQHAKGLSPDAAGTLLIVQPVAQMIFSPLAGHASDKRDPGKIATLGMVVTALGLFMLIWTDRATSLTFIAAASVVLGIGFGLFSSPNTNAIMSSVKADKYPIAASMLATMRLQGQLISMIVVTIIFSLVMGSVEIDRSTMDLFITCLRICFATLTALCAISIYLSSARGKAGE